jgi:ABC-type siderophore export system fused ATPase/permease subunit
LATERARPEQLVVGAQPLFAAIDVVRGPLLGQPTSPYSWVILVAVTALRSAVSLLFLYASVRALPFGCKFGVVSTFARCIGRLSDLPRRQSISEEGAAYLVDPGNLGRGSGERINIRALSEVSFEVVSGERVALIGPNGARKTTLLKVLAGVFEPTQGLFLLGTSVVPIGYDCRAQSRHHRIREHHPARHVYGHSSP